MKMNKELYNQIEKVFQENEEAINAQYVYIRDNIKHNDLNTYVSWQMYRFLADRELKDAVRNAGYDDSHITTALNKALKKVLKESKPD